MDAKEGEKTDIRKRLTEVLGNQFNQHMQAQQQELDDLEKKIAQLKAVLKKRLDAKSTIVERRADQLIQDAAGLGWNTPSGVGANGQQWYWTGPGSNKGSAEKSNAGLQTK